LINGILVCRETYGPQIISGFYGKRQKWHISQPTLISDSEYLRHAGEGKRTPLGDNSQWPVHGQFLTPASSDGSPEILSNALVSLPVPFLTQWVGFLLNHLQHPCLPLPLLHKHALNNPISIIHTFLLPHENLSPPTARKSRWEKELTAQERNIYAYFSQSLPL
jgi:hypothetical protein